MNPWTQFLDLLPKTPRMVGTVISHVGELHYIQLPDGSQITATNQTAVPNGSSVFVKDGVIEGTAPSLPVVPMDV